MSKIHVRLLKEAKKQLSIGGYICHTVQDASAKIYNTEYGLNTNSYKLRHKETYDILISIDIALGDSTERYGVKDWLTQKGIHLTNEEMYDYRQQWLDQMIEYWRDRP